LQIWLTPARTGLTPGYEQKPFAAEGRRGRLRVVASPDAHDESLTLHADAVVYAGLFSPGETAELELRPGRHAWVQVVRGRVRIQGQELQAGDGAALTEEPAVRVEGVERDGEVLVFDLA
jgi:redox-sensitive bicupin YhaK (pirin superfamily)